jgi:hypothetical protein
VTPVENPLKEWLAAFPAQAAETRLAELERRQQEINEEMDALRRFLDLAGPPPEIAGPTALAAAANGNGKPQGMDAVEIVMRERAGMWTRGEIGRELERRGWIAEGDTGRRTLGSIMNRMVSRGRVKRVGHARYRLPTPGTKEALAA